jgi:catechol 2,3-dioxygenase-like lactoylglutathione lyase family enzyme
LAFYTKVLESLGLTLKFSEPEFSFAGWKQPDVERPIFFITRPFDRQLAQPGNGSTVAFLAASRTQVDQCHAAALAAGGVCEGPPGPRPQYHADYYGAYFRDPDGNKLCVCCHTA